ncbi:MAG: DUF615 domain-containing protein [Legionellales bacterium]|nr:DUF615 domain-containing protein [Legionellales bacterium]
MDELKSKSQKKRDAEALQKVGVKLVALSLEHLNQLPLSPHLRQAILEAKGLKSHGAIRRQAQWIGKLMRTDECDAILAGFEALQQEASATTATFHEVEQWRSRLIKEGDEALTDFVNQYHPNDIQHLRQLIKKVVDETKKEVNLGASKALFRYLRSYLP